MKDVTAYPGSETRPIWFKKVDTAPGDRLLGHVLAELDGRRWLVDTGCPLTLGHGDPPSICGERWPMASTVLGMPFDAIRGAVLHHVGEDIAGILGADVFQTYPVTITLDGEPNGTDAQSGPDHIPGELAFGGTPPDDNAVRLPMEELGGCPVLSIGIGGRTVCAVLDTGAVLGYLPSSLTHGWDSLGDFNDFHPLQDMEWQTPVYAAAVDLGGASVACAFGNLPEALMFLLNAFRVEGILGSEFLLGRRVHLDGPNRCLYLESPTSNSSAG